MSAVLLPAAQTIDLHLPSGLHLRDTVAMATAKFAMWPWDLYDGVPVADPDVIADVDVDLSFRMGARTRVNHVEYRQRIAELRDSLTAYLREIPHDACLADPAFDLAGVRDPIVGLFNSMTEVAGMKLANASKIVHRHRQGLFPILDSVIRDYYWFAISLQDEALFLQLSAMSWGEYAVVLMDWLRRDLMAIGAELPAIRNAIAGTPFATATDLRLLESLIWYYYAGR